MESQQLSGDQVKALHDRLQPMADYLRRLEARMVKQGFADGEPLLMRVRSAKRGLDELLAGLQALSIEPLATALPKRRPKRIVGS